MQDQQAQRLTGRRRKTVSAFFADSKCIIWGFDTSIDTIQHAGTQVSNAKDFPRVFPSTRSETVWVLFTKSSNQHLMTAG